MSRVAICSDRFNHKFNTPFNFTQCPNFIDDDVSLCGIATEQSNPSLKVSQLIHYNIILLIRIYKPKSNFATQKKRIIPKSPQFSFIFINTQPYCI